MKLLLIHADRMAFKVTKAVKKLAEELVEERERTFSPEEAGGLELGVPNGEAEDCLVVFTSLESIDDDETVAEAVAEILKITSQLKVARIVLYPYAHLSKDLAKPDDAKVLIRTLEDSLREEGLTILRAPFGWYKSFELAAKGHPLAEWSREIGKKEAETREEKLEGIISRYLVLFPDGSEVPLEGAGLKDPGSVDGLTDHASMIKFINSEYGTPPSAEPPSIKAMMRQELIDYEPASDPGHFRHYPKGRFVFDMVKRWADQISTGSLGALQIDSPILYNWKEPDIRGQTQSFHERHYVVNSPDGGEFVLRFAGDFGLFRMMRDATISYKQLPVRVYEFSKSFRFEQHGELSGLRRLRAFHMPDLHSFAKDIDEGWDEYADIFRVYEDFTLATGVEYIVAFRVVESFYNDHKERITALLERTGEPAFIEIISEMKHYWAVKNEFQGIDSVGGNCQLATVQLDVEDAERYGITYFDEKGEPKGCIICHCSIGSIERWIFAILEEALKGEKPELPLWLAPTQLRFIPVNAELKGICEGLASLVDGRCDIDDRDEKVGRKIRDAEKEWANLIAVVGEREIGDAKEASADMRIPIRLRSGEISEMSMAEINELIAEGTRGYPDGGLPLPPMLSKRIKFRG